MLGFLFAARIVFQGFEGASLERVEAVAENHFRCHVKGDVDQDKRNRQANWYFFRVEGAAGHEITLDLVNLPGEYNYRPNRGAVRKETVPVWRDGMGEWRHFDSVEYDPLEPRLRIRLRPRSPQAWVAHVPPYTGRDLDLLLAGHRGSKWLRVESVGKTVEGRSIPLLTITGPARPAAPRKKVVWLMFRQHGWEAGSSWTGEGAVRYLLSAQAAALREESIWKIFPLCDPDGVARGNVRFNRFGFDLNRNWDVEDKRKMPEIYAQRKAILDWVDAGKPVDLFLSLHNTETSEYLEGPPGPEPAHRKLAERFFAMLGKHSTFAPTRPLFFAAETTTPGKPGRMTVSQGLYKARRLPAFIMEQMIARNPKLGRAPTIADRMRFGAELARSAFEAVR